MDEFLRISKLIAIFIKNILNQQLNFYNVPKEKEPKRKEKKRKNKIKKNKMVVIPQQKNKSINLLH